MEGGRLMCVKPSNIGLLAPIGAASVKEEAAI